MLSILEKRQAYIDTNHPREETNTSFVKTEVHINNRVGCPRFTPCAYDVYTAKQPPLYLHTPHHGTAQPS